MTFSLLGDLAFMDYLVITFLKKAESAAFAASAAMYSQWSASFAEQAQAAAAVSEP